MLATIARKEYREIVRDGRLRWLVSACLMLVVIAGLSGWQSTLVQLRAHAAASDDERSNFLEQGAKNPHAAAHFGQYAFRPVLLPAAFDPGASAYLGSMIWMEAHRQNLPEYRPAEDSAALGRATRLSPAWLLQFLLPLVIITMSFASVAGERERGTLDLALSQGVRFQTLLLGKALAVVGMLLAILLPLFALCGLLFRITLPGLDSTGTGSRLTFMALAYLLYLVGFAGISLLVSTLARTRRNAFLTLVAVWLLVTVVVPRVAADLAAEAYPTPSATEFWSAIRRGEGAGGIAEDPRARAAALRRELEAELLAQYGVDDVAALPVNFTAVFLQRLEEGDAPIFDHNFARLWDAYEAQRQAQQPFSLAAPAIAVRAISMALAGADAFAQHHFSQAAEQHRRDFVRELNELQAVEGAGKRFYVASADSWRAIDTFDYRPPETAEVLIRHRVDWLILALWAALPLALAQGVAGRSRALPRP